MLIPVTDETRLIDSASASGDFAMPFLGVGGLRSAIYRRSDLPFPAEAHGAPPHLPSGRSRQQTSGTRRGRSIDYAAARRAAFGRGRFRRRCRHFRLRHRDSHRAACSLLAQNEFSSVSRATITEDA